MIRSFAAALFVTAAFSANAQSWSVDTSCVVRSPKVDGQVSLQVQSATIETESSKTERLYVRFDSSEKLSDGSADFKGATLEIPGFLKLEDLIVRGAISRDNYQITVGLAKIDRKVLDAISSGAEARLTLPTPEGAKTLSVALDGSGLAIRKLRECGVIDPH